MAGRGQHGACLLEVALSSGLQHQIARHSLETTAIFSSNPSGNCPLTARCGHIRDGARPRLMQLNCSPLAALDRVDER